MSKSIAVILAGGSGNRMGVELPKQFIKVAGKSVIEHTIDVFQSHKMIDEVSVVINPAYSHIVEEYRLKNDWPKVKKVLNGGEERYHSSLSAIKAYEKEKDINLIFHDAVRPLVSRRIITDNIEALEKFDAVDTAVPSPDTIIQVDNKKRFIRDIPDRSFCEKARLHNLSSCQLLRKLMKKLCETPNLKLRTTVVS